MDMIEDINLKNAEASAILTMVLDEIQGIYSIEENSRNYELNRLKDSLIMSLYMMNERLQEVNKIAGLIMEADAKKGKS
ncbi:hypothetical protein [Lactococcus lactis]|uniref:hypothetical protein n=1 Tax=Lactococcus lactis TaxID=1358 RepID=UPI00072ACBD1|nr:hypothetical protein [Lactococcus lactis]KSU02407.1 hypothetical protein KF201_1056 [Lactococcus lactis subsp. lactis]